MYIKPFFGGVKPPNVNYLILKKLAWFLGKSNPYFNVVPFIKGTFGETILSKKSSWAIDNGIYICKKGLENT